MEFGALMFFTDYAMAATEFAQTLEARGFEWVWTPGWPAVTAPFCRRSTVGPS
jgi:hypothetical protein